MRHLTRADAFTENIGSSESHAYALVSVRGFVLHRAKPLRSQRHAAGTIRLAL